MVKKKNSKNKAAVHGPVTAISTAPVSIGNSLRGSKPTVINSTTGARVIGRDFAFALLGTASSVTGWELIGGMPITPSVLPSSVLRNYCQMYNKFKVNVVRFHYITSSPTSQAGDILFYFERDRNSPMCDYSNSSFLSYVLSDTNSIIGPQWTNHTMECRPVKEWKSTLYGNQTDINEDAAGSVFLFSKTNATNSPGYILIDYDISFSDMSVNPRAGSLPVSRGQLNQFCIGASAGVYVAGNSYSYVLTQKNTSNATATLPTGYANGDIYKCVAAVTASLALNTWTNVTSSTLWSYTADIDNPINIDDGFTFYIVIADYTVGGSTTVINAYPTLASASAVGGAGSTTNAFKLATTATVTFGLIVDAILVGNTTSLTQSAY